MSDPLRIGQRVMYRELGKREYQESRIRTMYRNGELALLENNQMVSTDGIITLPEDHPPVAGIHA